MSRPFIRVESAPFLGDQGFAVNVFDLDRALVSDYSRFARSFTQIRAPDIRSQVEQITQVLSQMAGQSLMIG